jgi:aspartate aminotransferase
MNDGDEVIIPEPMYANYIGFATAGNINVKPISCSIDNGFALPSIADFEKSITEKTKAILICNPNNPTGYLYSKEELETLRTIALKYDLYLIVDEVYREFLYGGTTYFSALNLEGMNEHVIVIDSISKRFSACGARIGAVVTRNKAVLQTVMKFAQARLSPPSLGQIAGNNATVMMAPATGFYKHTELGKKQVRIAYVLNTDDLTAAVECLKFGIEAYNKGK